MYKSKKILITKKQNHDINKKKDKIAKRLSILGIASRRDAEKLITDGRVKINGICCNDLSFLVSYEDKISVNGKEIINKPIQTKIFIINKPAGCVTTTKDPQNRKTIFDFIPNKFGNLITIGRLDYNTEGLLLLTNNGELAHLMEMPACSLKRVYFAKVIGDINENILKQLLELKNGITIDGVNYGKIFIDVDSYSPTKAILKITIFEGKNNEIRKIMWHYGLKVVKLTRVQYGDFKLMGLPVGCIQRSNVYIDIIELEKRVNKNIKRYNDNKNKQKSDKNIDTNGIIYEEKTINETLNKENKNTDK